MFNKRGYACVWDVDGGGSGHWADGESGYKETDCSLLLLFIFEP